MVKSKRATTLLLAIFFGLGVLCGLKVSWWWSPDSPARLYNTVAILQQVKTLSELVTVQYVIEKMEGLEVPSEHLVGQLIGSENRRCCSPTARSRRALIWANSSRTT